ncbi:PASTA domain-containing protein [Actinomarinicola tropica]|uniref:PASTA domain-containing protein n=1 Tax=Actinomarinicola tropica TaxID=2789776 RepID=A0A5Q2RP35_9ACTN|nr:PASTA domain-containing protein [Actinomarinicola tropica]QGG94965.1 PASTA domain-containing protein [Actinomarinicola tropica]
MAPPERDAPIYDEEYLPPPSHPLRLLVALGALAAATVACLVWFTGTAGLAGSTATEDLAAVPEVIGLSEAEASTAIDDAGFVIRVVPLRNVDVPAGEVFRQSPPAGTKAPVGSPVELVVSAGDEFVLVPQLYGSLESDLAQTLFFRGLGLGEVTYRQDPTTQPGEVLEQDPLPGTEVAAGTVVNVVVSEGPPDVLVPDVDGLSQAEAVQILASAGFNAAPVQRYSSYVPVGDVISTEPRAGREAPYGSTITVYVSRGRAPAPPTTRPPTTTPPTTEGETPPTTRPPTTQPPTTQPPTTQPPPPPPDGGGDAAEPGTEG